MLESRNRCFIFQSSWKSSTSAISSTVILLFLETKCRSITFHSKKHFMSRDNLRYIFPQKFDTLQIFDTSCCFTVIYLLGILCEVNNLFQELPVRNLGTLKDLWLAKLHKSSPTIKAFSQVCKAKSHKGAPAKWTKNVTKKLANMSEHVRTV